MDLRWQDSTGDTFVLRNGQILSDLLREHRPHWTEGQEFGILLPNEIRAFDGFAHCKAMMLPLFAQKEKFCLGQD